MARSKPGPKIEAWRVRRLLKSIYTNWDRCALKEPERGMKAGRPCDVCLEMVAGHMKELLNAK